MDRFERLEQARLRKLKPRLTEEFLDILIELAKNYGWSGDYVEVGRFIEWCYEKANRISPDLEPYPFE